MHSPLVSYVPGQMLLLAYEPVACTAAPAGADPSLASGRPGASACGSADRSELPAFHLEHEHAELRMRDQEVGSPSCGRPPRCNHSMPW